MYLSVGLTRRKDNQIEPPGGELTRFGGGSQELSKERLGLAFCTQNSTKIKSRPKNPDIISKTRWTDCWADIFVQNYRPGVADRLGLSEETVVALIPDYLLFYISLWRGGSIDIGAYDHVVQAMSGIMSTTGPEGSGPIKVGAPYIDYATGLNAAFA